jgi:O-antigen/teichoic acid export membrane protein
MLKRILKMIVAQGAGVAVILITQVLLPPIFLHSYGVAPYGEWLVLSATISYVATLNFGITTYASNELTILHQRGDSLQYRRLQASTLALVLALVVFGTAITVGVSLLPLNTLLHLHTMSRGEARLTALFLGLQMVAHIFGGYYNNLFLVIQEMHRGTMWWNLRRLSATLVAAVLALFHFSFAANAFGQFAAALLLAIAGIVDLRIRMKGLPMGIRDADWATAKAALKPSAMFAMILMQTFLVFQVPVILLQRILGPEVVVLFTIARTVLATARQILSIVTGAIAPEITLSFGSGDLKKLLDIFHYSERVVFSLIPVANLGTYLFSPVLLSVWLHKPGLFEPYTYALMALISGVMSVREHKQFFQFSTNTHQRLALIVFLGNLAMLSASIPMTIRFGLHGFMYTWLVSETTQMALLYRENRKLFADDPSITIVPVLRLAALMAVSLPLCILLLDVARGNSLLVVGTLATGGSIVLFVASWFLFGLNRTQARILAAVRGR